MVAYDGLARKEVLVGIWTGSVITGEMIELGL